jgi:hypothetical protein
MNEADKKMIDEIVAAICQFNAPGEELVRQAVIASYSIGRVSGFDAAFEVSTPVAKATIS